MTKIIAVVALCFTVSGCAKLNQLQDSKVNPMNWFGSNQDE
ncbi:MAG: hypothetical protein ACI9O0_000833 [Paracoccaceae bacterium]|jgi:hypothetical protein